MFTVVTHTTVCIQSALPAAVFHIAVDDQRVSSSSLPWSVTVAECAAEPLTQPLVDDAHGFIDFRTLGGSAAVKIAKRLAAFARARGRQHP
jgi:hypothetical protein